VGDFKWSHSRLTSFETCPRRHNECDLQKNYPEPPSAAMTFGSDAHKALELFCRDGVPLPSEFSSYQDVADTIVGLPGVKYYEQQLALTEDFSPCGFFDENAWFRCIVDVLIIDGDRALIVDYKTGKIKDDPSQLQLNAAAIFAHYPEVNGIGAAFWWIAKGKKLTPSKFTRAGLPDIWNKFLPRVKKYSNAVAQGKFFPNPSGLCKNYCPVKSCSFCGK
jgi:PD-(D/E)XK nuclease superfamily